MRIREQNTASNRRRTTCAAAILAAIAATGALTACSGDDGATGADGGPVTKTNEGNGMTMTVSTTEVADGDTVHVDVTGMDPMAGYYLALCQYPSPEGQTVPNCTGGREGGTQAWFRVPPQGTTPINEDGSGSTDLTIATTGEGTEAGSAAVNCAETECAIKLFGDHQEGFYDVINIPVTVK